MLELGGDWRLERTVSAYYNENDPFAATWLRELIKAGLITDGEVDTRSIVDVQPDDLRGFVQCHFFAGIGGWSYAIRLARWDDARPVWTGSCPCQPFSSAGAQAGGNDPRDLWPAWYQLVKECRPPVVFGEQVESAIGHGWLDRLCDDLEREDYAVGAVCLPAACVGAFHLRHRLYFVADTAVQRRQRSSGFGEQNGRTATKSGRLLAAGELAYSCRERREGERLQLLPGQPRHTSAEAGRGREVGEWGDTSSARLQERERDGRFQPGAMGSPTREAAERRSDAGFWSDAEWIPCRDGKVRPVESAYVWMADGVSGDVVSRGDSGDAVKAPWPTPVANDDNKTPDAHLRMKQRMGERDGSGANRTAITSLQVMAKTSIYAETQIDGDGRPDVRAVQQDELQTARSSQGSECGEQRSIELADFVRLLPSSLALAELHGHRATAEALHALLEASGAQRLVQYPPDQAEAAWRSLSQEAQDRFRLELGKGGLVRIVEFPLASGVPARVGRLRGYGNAIVPQVAQAFIESYMEVAG